MKITKDFKGMKCVAHRSYVIEGDLISGEDIEINMEDNRLIIEGSIISQKSIFVSGILHANQNIQAEGDIEATEWIEAGGWIKAGKNIEACAHICAGYQIEAGGDIKSRNIKAGFITARGNIRAVWGIRAERIQANGYIFGEDIIGRHEITADKSIVASGNIESAEGWIQVGVSITAKHSIKAGSSIRAGLDIIAGDGIKAGFDSFITGDSVPSASCSIRAGSNIIAGWNIESGFNIDAHGFIKAGLSIAAGWDISSDNSIQAGWMIQAGYSITAKSFIQAEGEIFAGVSIHRPQESLGLFKPRRKEIWCAELKKGEICHGKLIIGDILDPDTWPDTW